MPWGAERELQGARRPSQTHRHRHDLSYLCGAHFAQLVHRVLAARLEDDAVSSAQDGGQALARCALPRLPLRVRFPPRRLRLRRLTLHGG